MSMLKRFGKLENGHYSVDCGAKPGNEGRTKQSHRKECDINWIVQKARRTGMRLAGVDKQPMYADVSEVPDYATALMVIKEAEEKFERLDPKIRRRFGNRPEELIKYLENPELDKNEAIELGLLKKPEVVENATTTTNDDDAKN